MEQGFDIEGVVIDIADVPEGMRAPCLLSGRRFAGKVIEIHSCSVMKVCKGSRSVFSACKIHSVQEFCSYQPFVADFISTMERKLNGQEKQKRPTTRT